MLNFIMSLLLGSWAAGPAAARVARNPFWAVPYETGLKVHLMPAGERSSFLIADCGEFTRFVHGESAPSAEDVEFYRTLPLRGEMKDHYEVEFAVSESMESVRIDTAELRGLRSSGAQADSLTERMRALGLVPARAVRAEGLPARIIVRARDLACDLLAGKIRLEAEAPYLVSPPPAAAERLRGFYSRVEEKVAAVRAAEPVPELRAVKLGIELGELCRAEESICDAQGPVAALWPLLFRPGSLQLSEYWEDVSSGPRLRFPEFQREAPGMVILTASSANSRAGMQTTARLESEVLRLETELAPLGRLGFADMTEAQRQKQRELIRSKAEILKELIFQRYGRYR